MSQQKHSPKNRKCSKKHYTESMRETIYAISKWVFVSALATIVPMLAVGIHFWVATENVRDTIYGEQEEIYNQQGHPIGASGHPADSISIIEKRTDYELKHDSRAPTPVPLISLAGAICGLLIIGLVMRGLGLPSDTDETGMLRWA